METQKLDPLSYFMQQAEEASLAGGGWQPGEYIASITGITKELRMLGKKDSPTPMRGIWFDVVVDESSQGALPAGSKGHILIQTEGKNAHIDVKNFGYLAMALTGLPQVEAVRKVSSWIDVVYEDGRHTNEAQLGRGVKIGFKTREHTNKEGKKRYYPAFFVCTNQAPDDIAKNRARLDAADKKA